MKDSTSGWLERIFEDQYIDREWWGDFPTPVAWVGKNIHFKSLSDLVAVSGKNCSAFIRRNPFPCIIQQSSAFVRQSFSDYA